MPKPSNTFTSVIRIVAATMCALVAAATLAPVAHASEETAPAPNCSVTGLHLSWYPGTDTGYDALDQHGVVSAPEVLDALARDFAHGPRLGVYGETTSGDPSMQDFLVLWLPVWLNQLMSGTAANTYGLDPTRPEDIGKILWLSHVAGYYGGVWLRKDFLDFDLPIHAGLPFSNAGIDQYYSNFVDDVRAIADTGSPSSVLATARSTVRSGLVMAPSGVDSSTLVSQILPPLDNLAAFGYDATWLENILPPRLDSPADATPRIDDFFSNDEGRLLEARYGISELSNLTKARAAYQAVVSSTGAVQSRYRQTVNGGLFEMPLLLAQNRFSVYGEFVYGVGLPAASNYRWFNQEQYDRVLTWAAYAVMGNQANAMNALSAYATQDVAAARSELRATLVWASYVGSYAWGHLNLAVTADQSMESLLPTFVRAC